MADPKPRVLFIVINAPTPGRSGYTRRAEGLAVALDRLTDCRLLVVVAHPDAESEAATQARFPATMILRTSVRSRIQRGLAQVSALARGQNRWLGRYLTGPEFADVRDQVRRFAPDVVVAGHTGLIPLVAALGVPLARTIIDHHDPASVNFRRRLRGAGAVTRVGYVLDWWDMRVAERRCRHALAQWAVSEEDGRIIQALTSAPVTALPNAIPDALFETEPEGLATGAPPVIGFIGTYTYFPNVEAGREALDISVALKDRAIPHAFWLLGGYPPADLVDVARRAEHVEIPGFLPDVDARLRALTLLLAPIRTGSGTKVKILQALAMGIPVVTTSVGAEGLPLREQGLALVHDDRAGLEAACERLLADRDLRRALSEKGRRWAWEHVSQTRLEVLLEATLRDLKVLEAG